MAITSENKRGSDCSGTDGTANRILTLSNTQITLAGGFSVYVNGLQLVLTTEYTLSHLVASSTITLLNLVWDTDYITVIYVQSGGEPTSASYATTADVYTRTGLTTTEIDATTMTTLLIDAEAELEMMTGKKFTNANAYTEYLSIKDRDIIGNYQSSWFVSHWPIQSVTLCNVVDSDGTATSTFDTISTAEIAASTFESEDYWLEASRDSTTNLNVPNGKFVLKTQTLKEGTNNLKVSYTYGYSSVPRPIVELASSMAGIRAWVVYLGGQYESSNSYNLAEFSINKGDMYIRGKQNMEVLKMRIDSLLNQIGIKERTLFFATGSDR